MQSFEQKILQNISRHNLLDTHKCVIVAVSGGADSVALLCVLVSLGYKCVVAHCNFHLRGEESNRDEQHVMRIANELGCRCEITHFDVKTYEDEHKVSTEMACRELRYAWFEELRQQYDAQAIAVAHHRDDDIETMFLNLLRGSGIAGVAAMRWKNANVVRPMLNVSREDVENYLSSKNQGFVIDSTNLESEFKRNKLRNKVLPAFVESFPGADEMLAKSLTFLKENREIYNRSIEDAINRYKEGDVIKLSAMLDEYVAPTTLLFEMLNPLGFNFSQIESIIDSVGVSGRRFYARHWVAIINRNNLVLLPIDEFNRENAEYVINLSELNNGSSSIEIDNPIRLNAKIIGKSDFVPSKDGSEIYLDLEAIGENSTLRLRKWRDGDRLAPFGMKGTKKLSDIFSDAKLSVAQKNNVWVLALDDVILWVIGFRASRHFMINDSTKRILCIKNLQSGY